MATNVPHPGGLTGFRVRKVNRWVLAGGAAVVLGGGAMVYAKLSAPKVMIPPGDVYTVGYGNVVQTITASGTIEPPRQITLNFPQGGGVIAHIDVSVGQTVKAGQVLATLANTTVKPAVQSAEAAVASAKANLAALEQGPTPQSIALDQAAIQHAEEMLAGAQQQYQDVLASTQASSSQSITGAENQVTQDAAAVKSAQASVAAAQVKLQQAEAGISSQQQTLAADQAALKADQAVLANARQTLATDQATLSQDRTLYGSLASQYPQDEQAYQNALINYNSWSGYGQNPYTPLVSTTQQAANAAQNAYNTIQNAQNAVQSQQTAVLSAQQKIQSDEAAIQAAQAALASGGGSGSAVPLSVKADETALQQAEDTLQQAESNYQGALNTLAAVKQVNETSAQSSVDQIKNTIALDENAVTTAKDQLAQAEAPPTAAQIAQAQASIQSAEAQLATAQANAQNTVLTAPISGVIVASNYQPGDTVGSSPVFVLDNAVTSDLQVNANVSEADIGQVKPGERVSVTVPAFPHATFSGTVLQVQPNPQVINNVTEYTVLTTVANPAGKLLPGMTGNVTIETGSAHHILTVPAVALQTVGAVEGVYVEAGSSFRTTTAGHANGHPRTAFPHSKGSRLGTGSAGTPDIVFVPVKIGLFGSANVQITHGLHPGMKILLVPPTALHAVTRFPGRFGLGRGG